MTPEAIARKYDVRIRSILIGIKHDLEKLRYSCDEVWFDDGDDYRWSFRIKGGCEPVDLTFEICESEDRDGSKGGVTFRLDLVGESGRVYGDFSPFNYTPQVWVKRSDPHAVGARFRLFETCDYSTIPSLIPPHTPIGTGQIPKGETP